MMSTKKKVSTEKFSNLQVLSRIESMSTRILHSHIAMERNENARVEHFQWDKLNIY